MQRLLSQLSVRLLFKGFKLVTVESCTGGLISGFVTDLPGSSKWFEAGLVTYSNVAKSTLAKVPSSLIEKYGAVSLEVAEAMAAGAYSQFENCVTVAVTGIAGPDGGTKDKPVGTVCFAVCIEGRVISEKLIFDGDRRAVRERSCRAALNLLLSQLK